MGGHLQHDYGRKEHVKKQNSMLGFEKMLMHWARRDLCDFKIFCLGYFTQAGSTQKIQSANRSDIEERKSLTLHWNTLVWLVQEACKGKCR